MASSSASKGSSSKKKDTMNIDDLVDPVHGKLEFAKNSGNKKDDDVEIGKKIGNKKDDDVEVEDPRVGNDYGKVDCTTGIVNWSFTLGPWEAILLKAIIMLFLAGCLVFLVMKLIKEGRLLTEKDLVGKKA